MSLTLKQEPSELSPVNNPVPIIYSSSYSDEDGFRYRVRLIDSGLTNTELETFIYPDTQNSNYCVYDFSMVLSDLVGSDINWNVEDITIAPNSMYKFNYNITEFIGSTSGATTGGTLTQYYTFRGVKQYGDFWDTEDYIAITGTTPADFLSTKQNRTYKLTETATINTFNGTYGSYTTTWDRVVVNVYTTNIGKPYYFELGSKATAQNILTIPIGPLQINNMAVNGDIINKTTTNPTTAAILSSDDVYYEIYLENSVTDERVSEKIRIDLDFGCYKQNGANFLWLGDLSTYETYTFRNADFKGFSTSRNEVKSNYYNVNSDTYNYSVGDRGRSLTNVRTTESHVANSDWVTDEVAQDLMELYRSSDVYIIIGDNIYPVIITSTSYDEKTVRGNKLFNYSINYDIAIEKLTNS